MQTSLSHLDQAFTRFFKKQNQFPKFKSKKTSKQSFTIPQHVKINFETNKLHIPKFTPIKIILHRLFEGKIKRATIIKTSTNKYFANVLVEAINQPIPPNPIKEETTLGIDLGLTHFITTSQGKKIENPRWYRRYEQQLKKQQRWLSRKQLNSKNRDKQKLKVAKIHEKIRNKREDFLNKLSYQLTHENQVDTIVIESLDVVEMLQNKHLAKSIGDAAWNIFTSQLEYKCNWYGKNLIKIGRFEPSSKTCSKCGTIKRDLTLDDRVWTCSSCKTEHDRDINAAINIKNMGLHPKIRQELPELTLGESRRRKATRRTKKPSIIK